MSKNGSQFIINLVKLPNGYAYQSHHEAENVATKKKNPPKEKNKNPQNRPHRIFRELALDQHQPEDLTYPILEEPEPTPKQVQPEVEEQFLAELKRENGLPQSPAKWYDDSSIHQIEKQSLPQFFNGKSYKTPSLYLKFRNFIVALYRKNPCQYLTKIACRRILRGDVNTIMKIHSFLQKEGVINFCVSKQGNYTFVSSSFNQAINSQSRAGLMIDNFGDKDEQKSTQPVDMTNITLTTVHKCFSKSNRVFCIKCGSICGIFWFKKRDQSEKTANICFQCFETLPTGEAQQYVKVDIVKKIESGSQDSKAVWSIDDNLKLLQFVSNPAQEWGTLQNSFEKKKTFDDIMLQFMQFPIGNCEIDKNKITESALTDPPQKHAERLLRRFENSGFELKRSVKTPSQSLSSEQFTRSMVKMTKKLCEKFECSIKSNLKIQSTIEKTLFQLSSLRTVSNKKIQNMELPARENDEEFDNEFDEQSLSNQQQEQFNQNEPQNDDHAHDNRQGEELQDFMDNLQYN